MLSIFSRSADLSAGDASFLASVPGREIHTPRTSISKSRRALSESNGHLFVVDGAGREEVYSLMTAIQEAPCNVGIHLAEGVFEGKRFVWPDESIIACAGKYVLIKHPPGDGEPNASFLREAHRQQPSLMHSVWSAVPHMKFKVPDFRLPGVLDTLANAAQMSEQSIANVLDRVYAYLSARDDVAETLRFTYMVASSIPHHLFAMLPTAGLPAFVLAHIKYVVLLLVDDDDCFPRFPPAMQQQIRASCVTLGIAVPTFIMSRHFGFMSVGAPSCSTVFLPPNGLEMAPDSVMFVINHELAHVALNHSFWSFLYYLRVGRLIPFSQAREAEADQLSSLLTMTDRPMSEVIAESLVPALSHDTEWHVHFRKRAIEEISKGRVSLVSAFNLSTHGTMSSRVSQARLAARARLLRAVSEGEEVQIELDGSHDHMHGDLVRLHCPGDCGDIRGYYLRGRKLPSIVRSRL